MKFTRIIHPIGQGGFYTETLSRRKEEINIVYDCGGFNGRENEMNYYLQHYLQNGKTKKKIEAVFISHFHADHINGLQYLLENTEVKYLFLPQLKEDIVMEAFFHNYCMTEKNVQVNHFLTRLYYGETRFPTRIMQIGNANDHDAYSINPYIFDNKNISMEAWHGRDNKRIDLSSSKLLPSSTILHCGKWLYLPFNSWVAPVRRELIYELENELQTDVSIRNLSTILETNGVEKCKKIYEKVFKGKHNSYSMTLFSGLMGFHAHRYYKPRKRCFVSDYGCFSKTHLDCLNPNFLYLGDFEPQNSIYELERKYAAIWSKVESIQVPHHGSIKNYHRDLYKYPHIGIVSVGINNPYHHPDISTIMNIQSQGCQPIMVTEDENSMKSYCYKIY